jgi:hypothetical protein
MENVIDKDAAAACIGVPNNIKLPDDSTVDLLFVLTYESQAGEECAIVGAET